MSGRVNGALQALDDAEIDGVFGGETEGGCVEDPTRDRLAELLRQITG